MGNCGSRGKPTANPTFKLTAGSSEHPDLYAIYLRPRRIQRQKEVIAAMEFNRRWGGLHATLCSFAIDHGAGGEAKRSVAHGSDIESAMSSIHMAGQPRTLSSFQLDKKSAKLPITRSKTHPGIAMLKLPADHPGLKAMCAAAAAAGLKNARKPEELHITIGDEANAAGVREALWACEHWELSIAKSSGGEKEIRVQQFVDVKVLKWDGGAPSSRPSGSGASRKSAVSRSGRRYHVYAPSLPSQHPGDD